MSERFEYYTLNYNGMYYAYGTMDMAQTFTPAESHNISKVKLKLRRGGYPGTVTVSIKATAGGVPTGDDLISTTINGNDLVNTTAGAWYDIEFTGTLALTAETKYAIVLSAPSGDVSNAVYWRLDSLSPAYTGGTGVSYFSGSWHDLTYDFMFEEWGYPEGGYAQTVGSGSISIASTLGQAIARAVGSGALSISGILDMEMVGKYFKAVGSGAVAISGAVNIVIARLAGFINLLFRNHKKPFLTFRGG